MTGDSLSMPLDAEVARRLEDDGIEVVRDPQVGTGISAAQVGDWGSISVRQAREEQPDAIVIFIGANEGFPMPEPGGGDGRVLRRGLGRRVRLARPADDGHLPPGRRGARRTG